MTDLDLRPRADPLLRSWGQMIQTESEGPGFDFTHFRQATFKERVERFSTAPSSKSFDAIWTPEATVEHSNPGGAVLRSSFDGDVDDLAEFLEMLRTSTEYNKNWEDRFKWKLALWEIYTRLNESIPIILTSESTEALKKLGPSTVGGYREKAQTLRSFREHYESTVGHSTQATSHQVPLDIEIEQLFHTISTVSSDDIRSQLKGPYGNFYRLLYGGSEISGGRDKPVQFVQTGSLLRAFAWAKSNGAYDKPNMPEYWGGDRWENWKRTYADHVQTEIREEFTLDNLTTDDIAPFFDALTDAEASDLGKPVATYVMGGQWGQYTWDDVVAHFSENPVEASQVLSLFFDDSLSVVNRLEAFKEHTAHLSNKKVQNRSPGTIERMATSLLMFTFPEKHLGLPSSRTSQFLEEYSTLPKYKPGFRPHQYQTIIGPFRGFKDDIQRMLDKRGFDMEVDMLDVHSIIWTFGGKGSPSSAELPPDGW